MRTDFKIVIEKGVTLRSSSVIILPVSLVSFYSKRRQLQELILNIDDVW